jgi:DNA-binding transcriptional LysR family regulator
VAPSHPFAKQDVVHFHELHNQRYLARSKCEVMQQFLALADELGVKPLQPYMSDRDDWIEAMVLAGWGFSFFPQCAVTIPGLVRRPLVEPEFTRTINLVTVRGRPHSPAVGAFVREVMRRKWDASEKPRQAAKEAPARKRASASE